MPKTIFFYLLCHLAFSDTPAIAQGNKAFIAVQFFFSFLSLMVGKITWYVYSKKH